MSAAPPNWSTQQLVEFMDAVSSAGNVATAADRAVERAAEALEAEIAAIVRAGKLVTSIGYPREAVPTEALVAAASGGQLQIEGLGTAAVTAVPIGDDTRAQLIIGRIEGDPLRREDLNLLHGMGRVLDLTFKMLRGLEEERALRKQSQRIIREREQAEEKYRDLVEQLPGIFYVTEPGPHGRWDYVSPQVERLLGFTQAEWLADPELWAKQLHPDDRGRVLEFHEDLDPNAPIDYRLVGKDGQVVWFQDEAALKYDAEGNPFWQGALYDISERKRVEKESQRLKDEFFALVSHELRTPLTSIIGYIDLLHEEAGHSVGAKHSLEVIDRNAKRLRRLVGDLLFAAQVEAGTFEVELEEMRADELARECVEAALPRAERHGVELYADLKPLPSSVGDPNRLSQAIDNLLSNALKFTPPGGRVTLRVERPDDMIRISVEDTGIGIPKNEQGHLFERFYRSSNVLSGSSEGAGLGLAIVQAIVEAHEGRIGVDSTEGVGTTISIEIPFKAWQSRTARHPAFERASG